MLLYPDSKNRPFHLGTYPLEVLDRDETVIAVESERPKAAGKAAAAKTLPGNSRTRAVWSPRPRIILSPLCCTHQRSGPTSISTKKTLNGNGG